MFDLSLYNFSEISYDVLYDLAKMSRNVYYKLEDSSFTEGKWMNVSLPMVFDTSIHNDTVRSYLFTNFDRSVNVVSFKGTSLPWFSFDTNKINQQGTFTEDVCTQQGTFTEDVCTQQGTFTEDVCIQQGTFTDDVCIQQGTSTNDKANDNLYYSCCFYKHNTIFPECDCGNTIFSECNCGNKINGTEKYCCASCYKSSTVYDLNYMNIADNIIKKIKEYIDFENSIVIFTGHSLGGTLASMMGLTYNKIAVAFESPGDKHYIDLVGLGDIPSDNIYHFGHDADPLFIGNCGMTCSSLGYYVDTKCHVGNTCLFKAKEKLGYSESILKHRIDYVINNIMPNWETDFPECVKHDDCIDCADWVYI